MRCTLTLALLAAGLVPAGSAPAAPPAPAAATDGIAWIRSLDEGLALAAATRRPLLVNFWCGT